MNAPASCCSPKSSGCSLSAIGNTSLRFLQVNRREALQHGFLPRCGSRLSFRIAKCRSCRFESEITSCRKNVIYGYFRFRQLRVLCLICRPVSTSAASESLHPARMDPYNRQSRPRASNRCIHYNRYRFTSFITVGPFCRKGLSPRGEPVRRGF